MTAVLVIAVLAGLVCVWAGLREVRKQRRLARDGVPVTGWVYRLDHRHNSNGNGVIYTPLIAFRDENGIEHKFPLGLSEGTIRYPVGSEVPLRHVPGHPDLVDLDTGYHKRMSLLLPFGIGAVFIAAALWAFLG